MSGQGAAGSGSARSEGLTVRIADVTVGITLSGCNTDLIDAVHAEYAPMMPSVPVSAETQVVVAADADAGSGVELVRREVDAAVAGIHRQRGFIDFGADLLVDDRGSALIVTLDGSEQAHAVMAALSARHTRLPPGSWVSDRSGNIVHRAASTTIAGDALENGAVGGPARLIGALLLGDGESVADAEQEDGVLALARHAIEQGSPNERAPVLRAVQMIAGSTSGIRRVAVGDLSRALREVAERFAEGPRTMRFAPPFPVHSAPASVPTNDGSKVWFRGPAHDYLQRDHDVLVVRRSGDGLELEALQSHAGALWMHADGASREQLLSIVRDQSSPERSEDTPLEVVFDELVSEGLLVDEPSWAVRSNVAYSTNSSQAFVLGTDGGDLQPLALEGPAMTIWEAMIEQPHISITEITAWCAERYDVDADDIRPEVQQMMEDLRERDLIGWV